MAYNSENTGTQVDEILGKVKQATVATADAAGEGGLTPPAPAGSQDGSQVLKSDMTWGNLDERYLPRGGQEEYTPTNENDPATKKYVDDKTQEAVSSAKMKKLIVTVLPSVDEADSNAIYLIKDDVTSTEETNVYNEYFLVENQDGVKSFEMLGYIKTGIDLSEYMKTADANNAYQPKGSVDGMPDATTSARGIMTTTDKSDVDFITGYNSVTTLTNLPSNKRLVIANVSGATNISVANNGLKIGQELYISVMPSSTFTQNIPSSGSYRSMCGNSLDVTSGTPYEISILKIADSGVMYTIMAKSME